MRKQSDVNGRIQFTAEIKHAGGGGAFVEVPFDVEKTYGKKRVKIQALFEGVPYRGTLVRMKSECHMLIILKEIREKTGKQPGDTVHVELWEDTEPRVVLIPDDVTEMLKSSGLQEIFEKLSYTHQREYINWITEAKRTGTRLNRIEKMGTMLQAGKKEPK
ncbi:MAG: DUF1905 domain-containing protein [Ignavibacteriales bacterium]|nr:DUF1905 domain-containing protein [Ignavibacteriales bacterium]